MSWQSKMAAIAGLAASVLAVSLLIASLPSGSIAFAQVAEKLQAAQTLSFDSELKSTVGGKMRTMKSRNYYMTPGKHRTEMHAEGDEQGYVVFDIPAGKVAMVDDKRKEARISEIKGGAGNDIAAKTIEDLRTLDEQESRSLGEKQIDGIRAKGFVIEGGSETTTVWADAATGEPVRIEIVQKNAPDGPIEIVWTNIKLDEPLDAQLFSVTPPEGYVVKPFLPVDLNATPAEYVAGFLKIYIKHMDGRLPANLTDAFKTVAEKIGPPDPENPPAQELMDEMMQLSYYAAAVRAVITVGKQGEDWQYYPDGAAGDKEKIVFWSRDKKDGNYLAVFGDLRVEEVSKDQLPAVE